MGQAPPPQSHDAAVDSLVLAAIKQYRSRLLDLSNRNPLINFRHSERSRTHLRIVNEIPEILFKKLDAGKELSFDAVPEPVWTPPDEHTATFETELRRGKKTDQQYAKDLAELGPNPSDRQKRKIDRQLRDRIRKNLGLAPFELVTDPKKRAAELGISTEHDLPKKNGQAGRHFNDQKVQTLFFADDLARKLSAIRESAHVLLHDAGLNALYLAFGFLEYYESSNSDEKRLAPLVFFPVELERELANGEYRYSIRATNDDIEINVALAELLRTQLGIELPPWKESEEPTDLLEIYFQSVEAAIAGKQDWRMRRFVTLGLFTFSTLVMYKDLDPQRWPVGTPIHGHPILRTLIAGAETNSSRYAEDYDIDKIGEEDVLLVTEADSSQHSAVVDVVKGKSCVIQGPPGTGKSQTITNIVSAALNAGKSVLFVAEKMAALEVVHKRLKASGLEHFCFELHSTKTSKTAVVQSLASRLDYSGPKLQQQRIESNLEALQRARKDLIYYVQKANEQAGVTGLTVQEILLGSAKRQLEASQLSESVAAARFSQPLEVTTHRRTQMMASADTLERQSALLQSFGPVAQHPWRGLRNTDLTEFDHPGLLKKLEEWRNSIQALQQEISAFEKTTSAPGPQTVAGTKKLCELINTLEGPTPQVNEPLFLKLSTPDARQALGNAIELLEAMAKAEERLRSFADPIEPAIIVGSIAIRELATALNAVGIESQSIAALATEEHNLASEVAELGAAVLAAQGLKDLGFIVEQSIEALTAAVAGIDLLKQLPRELVFLRDSRVLDEANASLLSHAENRRSGLVRRRQALEARLDLSSLPSVRDLDRFVFALKSKNAFTALFDAECKEAKKLHRVASRHVAKASRLQVAADFSDSSRYVKDEAEFNADLHLREVCGDRFDGLKTPLGDLIQLNQWAARASSDMSRFGDSGNLVRRQLYEKSADYLDRVLGFAERPDFRSLRAILAKYPANPAPLPEIHQREARRLETLRESRSTLQHAGIADSLSTDALPEVASCLSHFEELKGTFHQSDLIRSLIGEDSKHARTSLAALKATHKYVGLILALPVVDVLKRWLVAQLGNATALRRMCENLHARCAKEADARARFCAAGDIDEVMWAGSFDGTGLDDLLSKSRFALGNASALRDYVSYLIAEDEAYDSGIGPLLEAIATDGQDCVGLSSLVDLVFFRSAAEQVLATEPRLRRHSGTSHEQLQRQYQELDREYLQLRRAVLASRLVKRPVPAGNSVGRAAEITELALVERVARQTKPRITVRDLVFRSGKAIQCLKPCWMMSPMSVAQFLTPGHLKFDLVVMDEASQIRPEEALGAVIRGGQLVVVGDQMQLPPTPFFQKLSVDTTDSDDNFVDEKQESVLEAAASRFFPPRRLKWHYRSKHGGLISFSNQEFYDNDLIVFPSPHHDHPEYGVKHIATKGAYAAGFNEGEAREVVNAAAEFMEQHPDTSLGIVAVNKKQADFIREEIDRLCAVNPRAQAYRVKWDSGLEELLVKNLENVQGDERDVIFISTVYGPDANGNFHQRFGPINGMYGHRRLNVLFTRARKKVVVFSSMTPEEIQHEGKQPGVRILKSYLQYARDGRALATQAVGEAAENEFEKWVSDSLKANGYEAVPQLGFEGYSIDIAVRHPHKPGVFICGIECDGATYHSAPSVRERDRLRQEILENLGWNIYRIWSTDWFRNPELQRKRLFKHLEELSANK